MLKSITTKNFKKLTNHRFDFTDGLNIICGENWAGKTTLTKAIAFALFGVKAVGKSENIPTWGSKDTEVTLEVGEYSITRTLKNCSVSKNGESVAVGNSTCSDYIQANITGVDYKGFKMFNWSGQEETAAILTIGATQLQRDIEKFSGVQFIDNIIKAANKDLTHIEGELDGAEMVELNEHEETLAKIEHKRDGLQETLEQELHRSGMLSNSVDRLTEEVADAKKIGQKYSQLKLEIAELTSSLSEAEQSSESLRSELAELPESQWDDDQLLKEVKAKLSKGVSLNAEIIEATKRQKRLTTELEKFREEESLNAGRAANLEQLQTAADNASALAAEANEQINSLLNKQADLKQSLKDGICHECKRPFEGHDIEETEASLKAMIPLIEEAEERNAAAATKKLETLKALRTAEPVVEVAEKITKTNAEIAELVQWLLDNDPVDTATLETEVDKLTAAKATAASLTASRDRVVAMLTKAEKRAEAKRTELEQAEFELSSLPDTGNLLELEEELESCNREFNVLQLQLKELEHELATMNTDSKYLSKYIEEGKANNERITTLAKESALLSTFIKFLRDSRVTFLASVWDQILGLASAFVAEATEGAISAIIKKDGFEFCEDGTYVPVEEASGAQRGFIGVAMRVALAESIRVGLPTIILDEPSAAMREENAAQLAGGLLGKEQILMITHRESDQVSGSSIIEL